MGWGAGLCESPLPVSVCAPTMVLVPLFADLEAQAQAPPPPQPWLLVWDVFIGVVSCWVCVIGLRRAACKRRVLVHTGYADWCTPTPAGRMLPRLSPGLKASSFMPLHHPPHCSRQPAPLANQKSRPTRWQNLCAPTVLADARRRGARRSGIKEEPREGRGTAAEASATPACGPRDCHSTSTACGTRNCKTCVPRALVSNNGVLTAHCGSGARAPPAPCDGCAPTGRAAPDTPPYQSHSTHAPAV